MANPELGTPEEFTAFDQLNNVMHELFNIMGPPPTWNDTEGKETE